MSPASVRSTRSNSSLCASFLACALSVALSCVAYGMQQGSNTLTIQVVGGGGAGSNMIHVELVRGNGLRSGPADHFGAAFRDGYCDARGFRTFMALPDGEYTINVTAPDTIVSPRSIRLYGATKEQVVYHLQPATARGREGSSNSVPIQWLAVPDKARKRYVQGKEDYDHSRYDGAVKDLQAALAVHPDFVMAHNLLGWTWWRMQKTDLARASFETSLRQDPKFLPTYLDYAGILIELGDFERAGQVLDGAAKVRPDIPELYFAVARMQFARGNLDLAEQNCRRVLERDRHKIPDVHLVLSNIYLRRNRLDQAETELEAYLVRAPMGAFAKAARDALAQIKSKR